MRKVLLVVLIMLALFLFYPEFPGFATKDFSGGPDCAVMIEGKGGTVTVVTKCGKRVQFLMENGRYKAWRYEGETNWRPIVPKPYIKLEEVV